MKEPPLAIRLQDVRDLLTEAHIHLQAVARAVAEIGDDAPPIEASLSLAAAAVAVAARNTRHAQDTIQAETARMIESTILGRAKP